MDDKNNKNDTLQILQNILNTRDLNRHEKDVLIEVSKKAGFLLTENIYKHEDYSDEIWKDIPGYEESYAISNYGRVLSKARTVGKNTFKERIMKGCVRGNHVYLVLLKKGSKPKNINIARLVLEMFVEKASKGKIACHIDGNPRNNYYKNLYWGTSRENTIDLFMTGTATQSKLTPDLVRKIKKMYEESDKKYGVMTKIEKELGLRTGTVSDIVRGKSWKFI